MIKIICTLNVKPDKVEEFKDAAQKVVEGSRAEAGNVSYAFNQGIDDETSFAFVEVWADQEALDAHDASEHFTAFVPVMGRLSVGDPFIGQYREL